MSDVLGFEEDDVHSNFKELRDVIFARGKNYTLTEANRIFSKKGTASKGFYNLNTRPARHFLLPPKATAPFCEWSHESAKFLALVQVA